MLSRSRHPYSEAKPDRAEAEPNYCRMLTLGKFAVLGAMFLSGVAIAANADPLRPANPGALGTVANAAVGSWSPGPEVAALPPANTAAPNNLTLPEISVFGVATHPYTSRLGPKASPSGTLRMDHYSAPPEYETNAALHPYTSHFGPKDSPNGTLRAVHYQLPRDYAKDVAMHPYGSHLGPCIASCKILDRITSGTAD